MPRQPLHFEVPQEPCSPAVDAAMRRRLRSLESAFPAVRNWSVTLARDAAGGRAEPARVRARATATIVGGTVFEAHGTDSDVLSALRLALNHLERQLQEDSDGARHRAAQWLAKVRTCLGQRRAEAMAR